MSLSAFKVTGNNNPDRQISKDAWNSFLDTITETVTGLITEDMTLTVAPTGADFTEPGAAFSYLQMYRITDTATVTVDIAEGTYTCTTLRGHTDGDRIVVTTPGLNGAAISPVYDAIGDTWSYDGYTLTGVRADDKVAVEAKVRAKYKVVLEFADGGAALSAAGKHSGTWGAALFINTGTCAVGAMTGTGDHSAAPDGPSGVVSVDDCAFFGFTNSGLLTDNGGTITCYNAHVLYNEQENTRTDFAGTIQGQYMVNIGAPSYGHRGNHGGQAWMDYSWFLYNDDPLDASTISSGATFDNVAMGRLHFCTIESSNSGLAVHYGANAKVFGATIRNNTIYQIECASGTVDARGVQMESNPAVGATYGVRKTGTGEVNVQAANLTPFGGPAISTSVITGHTYDLFVSGNGTIFTGVDTLVATYGGAFRAPNYVTTPDSTGWLKDERRTRVVKTVSSTYTILDDDLDGHVSADASGGAFNVTIPTVNENMPEGTFVTIRKIDSGTHFVTARTPAGAVEVPLTSQYASATFEVIGGVWTLVERTALIVTKTKWSELSALDPALHTNAIYHVTDVGINGGSLWSSDGVEWGPLHEVVLDRTAVTIPHTGTTSATSVRSVNIPAGLLGLNRGLEYEVHASFPASANSKAIIARLGTGAGLGTAVINGSTTTATHISYTGTGRITNRNSASSQIIGGPVVLNGDGGFSTAAATTATTNTAAATVASVNFTLGSAAETINLERFILKLIP